MRNAPINTSPGRDFAAVGRRDYSHAEGDERHFRLSKAIERGRKRCAERGVRQRVLVGGPAVYGGSPLFIVQDI